METETKVNLNFEVAEATRREFKSAAAIAGKTMGDFLAQILAERRAAGLDPANGADSSHNTTAESQS